MTMTIKDNVVTEVIQDNVATMILSTAYDFVESVDPEFFAQTTKSNFMDWMDLTWEGWVEECEEKGVDPHRAADESWALIAAAFAAFARATKGS